MYKLSKTEKQDIFLLVKSSGWNVLKKLAQSKTEDMFNKYLNNDDFDLDKLNSSKAEYQKMAELIKIAEQVSHSVECEQINLTNEEN